MSYKKVQALLSRGISRPTYYRVVVPKVGPLAQDQLEFLCSAATVPEVSTQNVLAMGHDQQGVIRDTPAYVIFGKPFTINVICDRDYIVYKAVRQWFDTISTGTNGGPQKMAYYDTFANTDITLEKLELNGKDDYVPFVVQFKNAYPTSISSLEFASDAYDSRMEFSISFAYETYAFVPNNLGVVGTALQSLLNTLL